MSRIRKILIASPQNRRFDLFRLFRQGNFRHWLVPFPARSHALRKCRIICEKLGDRMFEGTRRPNRGFPSVTFPALFTHKKHKKQDSSCKNSQGGGRPSERSENPVSPATHFIATFSHSAFNCNSFRAQWVRARQSRCQSIIGTCQVRLEVAITDFGDVP